MNTNARESLSVPAADVLLRLPQIGRLMVTAKQGGATHERIGVVGAATQDGDAVVLSGGDHDSRVNTSRIAEVIVDRTSMMRDQAYPRVDFLDGDGATVVSVVGFGGLEPFDAALLPLGPGTALPPKSEAERGPRGEVIEGDPGRLPFDSAQILGQAVTIRFAKPGFEQRWQGVVEAVNPAMGFINVMRPDFHLHLKSGAVAGWRQDEDGEDVVFHALDAEGSEIGLSVCGPAALAAAKSGGVA